MPSRPPPDWTTHAPQESSTPVEGVLERAGPLLRASSVRAQALGTPRAAGGEVLRSASLPSLGRRARLSLGSGWASVGRAGAVAGASAPDRTRSTGNAGEQQPAGVCPLALTGGVCPLTFSQCYLYKMLPCQSWCRLRRPFAGRWLVVGGADGAFTAQGWNTINDNERLVARRSHSGGTVCFLSCAVIADGLAPGAQAGTDWQAAEAGGCGTMSPRPRSPCARYSARPVQAWAARPRAASSRRALTPQATAPPTMARPSHACLRCGPLRTCQIKRWLTTSRRPSAVTWAAGVRTMGAATVVTKTAAAAMAGGRMAMTVATMMAATMAAAVAGPMGGTQNKRGMRRKRPAVLTRRTAILTLARGAGAKARRGRRGAAQASVSGLGSREGACEGGAEQAPRLQSCGLSTLLTSGSSVLTSSARASQVRQASACLRPRSCVLRYVKDCDSQVIAWHQQPMNVVCEQPECVDTAGA